MKRLGALLTALLLPLAANPAFAEHHFERGGSLGWSYSKLNSRASNGKETEASGFSQTYELWGRGPMITPALGRLNTTFNFSDGLAQNQSVSADSPKSRLLGYQIETNLLRPGIRKYISLDARTNQVKREIAQTTPEGSGPKRSVTQELWGFSSALRLPKLPSVRVSRDFQTFRDVSTASPLRTRTNSSRESMNYRTGPASFNLEHSETQSFDDINTFGNRVDEKLKGSMTMNFTNIKATGPGDFYIRSDYTKLLNNGNLSQHNILTNTRLRSDRLRVGSWKSHLGHNMTLNQDAKTNESVFSNTVDITSEKRRGLHTWTQKTAATRVTSKFPSNALNQSLGHSAKMMSGRMSSETRAEGGYRDSISGAFISDNARTRLNYAPRPNYKIYTEFYTLGRTPQGPIDGGNRSNTLKLGAGFPIDGLFTADTWFQRLRNRNFESGVVTMTDTVSLGTTFTPLHRLTFVTKYHMDFYKHNGDPMVRRNNLTVRARYLHDSGFSGTWEFLKSENAIHSKFEAGYVIGKAEFGLLVERRTLPGGTAFGNTNFFLKRRF